MVLVRLNKDVTRRAKAEMESKSENSKGKVSCSNGHRCGLPFVLTDVEGAVPLPLPTGLPFELNRGFFGTFASPASLITILA
jgi:hypothetical protein